MLTVDISLPEVEELQRLVETGKEKGFLTYDEIVTGLEEVDLTKEQLEDFTTYLIDHGVELMVGEQHKSLPHEEPVPEEELVRSKEHLKGSLMLSLEHTGSRMNHLARQEIYFGRPLSLDEVIAGIDAVTAPLIQKVAGEIFDGELTMSLLGNLKGYRAKPSQLRI